MEQDNMMKKMCILIGTMIFSSVTQAAILWAGGEDVDFPNGGTTCLDNTYRTGYSRGAVHPCSISIPSVSNTFSGGAITSAWLSAQISGGYNINDRFVGLTKLGTNSGLYIGSDSATAIKVALWKYDGTTWTKLATESSGSLIYGTAVKVDMQLINYGASATVNIYTNGGATPRITYSGDVLAGSATNLDSVILRGSGFRGAASEIIVSDSDTRKLSLVTLTPNAAGDTNQWTGAHTNINTSTFNDASTINESTSGEDFQTNLSALPSGNFQILGVRVAARATQTGAGITSIALGVKTNTTINIPSATLLPVTWTTIETFFSTNPVTTSQWSTTEINALQLNFQSAP